MNIDIHQKKVELSEIDGILFDMASDIVCDLNIERHTVVRKMLESAEYEKLRDYNRERLRLHSLVQALKKENEELKEDNKILKEIHQDYTGVEYQ